MHFDRHSTAFWACLLFLLDVWSNHAEQGVSGIPTNVMAAAASFSVFYRFSMNGAACWSN